MVNLAKILKPHGLKGEMKINPFTDDITVFKTYKYFFINQKKYEVEHFKGEKSPLILKLKNINTIDDMLPLKNNFLSLKRVLLHEKTGELIEDYLGLKVFNEQGENLGVIKDCYTGGTDMFYRISKEKKNWYVPCKKNFFQAVDFSQKKITLKTELL